jgi:hypothetical protein
VTTIVGPVVTEVSGEKWPGSATSSSLVFLPLPLRPQHNWTAAQARNWPHPFRFRHPCRYSY